MMSNLLDRIRDARNRKVSDPAFRRWARRFALTRPFARRQAKQLFDLTAGFVYSQILSACVRIDLFDRLADGPLRLSDIAARCGLAPDATERLLKAAAALGLVEGRNGGSFALGPLGAALVGNEGVFSRMAGGRGAERLDRLFSRVGKRLALRQSSEADVISLVKAWGILDAKCHPTLLEVARRPGALRGLTKVLRLASMNAAADNRDVCCEDVRAAAAELGGVS